jgi:hypothetical protein
MDALLLTLAVFVGGANPNVFPQGDGPKLREAVRRLGFARPTQKQQRPPLAAQTFRPPASRGRTIFISAVLGMVAGTGIGIAMDRNCNCDSPGMAGLVYGAPIGAAVGGTLGVLLTK